MTRSTLRPGLAPDRRVAVTRTSVNPACRTSSNAPRAHLINKVRETSNRAAERVHRHVAQLEPTAGNDDLGEHVDPASGRLERPLEEPAMLERHTNPDSSAP